MSGAPKDYVDVAQRIQDFYAFYPDGRLTSDEEPRLFHVGDKTFMAYCAKAYRTPDDQLPGVGWAWEPVPGPTPFTRDSELQNAETSAWGRAIVALGFETKHIASANEVRNRQASSEREQADLGQPASRSENAPATDKPATSGQLSEISMALKLLNTAFPENNDGRTWNEVAKDHAGKSADQLTMAEAEELRTWLEDQFRHADQEAKVPFGEVA